MGREGRRETYKNNTIPAPTRIRRVVRDHATNAPFLTTCPEDLTISTTSSTVISGAEMAMIL